MMKLKKYSHFYKNTISDTNILQLWFPIDENQEEIAARTILPSLIMKTSLKYQERDLMQKECTKRYIISMNCSIMSIGINKFFVFGLEFPKKKMISDIDIDSCLDFFHDTILNPNIKNGEFVKLEEEKRRIKMGLDNQEKDKYFIIYKDVINKISPGGFLSKNLSFYPEQLEQLESAKILNLYNKIIKNQTPFIFLYGAKELKDKQEYIENKWFKTNGLPKINNDCNQFLDFYFEKEIVKEAPYHESILALVYRVKDMSENDRMKLIVINRILSSSATNILLKKLRDEEKIVYHAGSTVYSHFGFLTINCFINKDAKDKAISSVKNIFDQLKDVDFLEKNLIIIREQAKINILLKQDNKYSVLNDYVDKFFGIEKTYEEELEILNNLDGHELKELVERLELSLIYFLKGVGDAS